MEEFVLVVLFATWLAVVTRLAGAEERRHREWLRTTLAQLEEQGWAQKDTRGRVSSQR